MSGTENKGDSTPRGFSLRDSSRLKGIGIVLMLFHHLFNDHEEYAGYAIDYAPFTDHRLTQIAQLGVICVAIFVFVSGYGLTKSYRAAQEKNGPGRSVSILGFALQRWWDLMTQYWVVFAAALLLQPLGRTLGQAYAGGASSPAVSFASDLFGLSFLMGTPTLNPTWWYMTLAILFLFLAPCVNALMDRVGLLPGLVACAAAAIALGRGNAYCIYTIVLLAGIVCARTEAFTKIAELLDTPPKRMAAIAVAVLAEAMLMIALLREYTYFGITRALTAFCTALLCRLVLTDNALGRALEYLGEHSTNMFLFHNLLYCYYFPGFFFGLHYWWLVTAALIAASLFSGLLLEWLSEASGYLGAMEKLGRRVAEGFRKASAQ